MTYDVFYGGSQPKTRDVQTRRVLRRRPRPPMRQGAMLNVVGAIMTPATAQQLA